MPNSPINVCTKYVMFVCKKVENNWIYIQQEILKMILKMFVYNCDSVIGDFSMKKTLHSSQTPIVHSRTDHL